MDVLPIHVCIVIVGLVAGSIVPLTGGLSVRFACDLADFGGDMLFGMRTFFAIVETITWWVVVSVS